MNKCEMKENYDTEEIEELLINNNYKDSVFRTLFNSKEKLLELYNGLNGSNYTDTENLKINTLSDAVFMGYKNDVFLKKRQKMIYYIVRKKFQ